MPVTVRYSHIDRCRNNSTTTLADARLAYPFSYLNAEIRSFGDAGFSLNGRLGFREVGTTFIHRYAIPAIKEDAIFTDDYTAVIGNPRQFQVRLNERSVLLGPLKKYTQVSNKDDMLIKEKASAEDKYAQTASIGKIFIDGIDAGTEIPSWDRVEEYSKKFCSVCEKILNAIYPKVGLHFKNDTIFLAPRDQKLYLQTPVVNKIEIPSKDKKENNHTVNTGKHGTSFLLSNPTISFSDVGGYDDLVGKLKGIAHVLKAAYLPEGERPQDYGVKPLRGILLHGPPGVGKSYLGKALAGETGFTYIEVALSEILNMWFGNSEKFVKDLYTVARDEAKAKNGCIVIINEAEALFPDRAQTRDTMQQVTSAFLQEVEKINEYNILTVATTNYPDMIERAMLRPGRFFKSFEVSLPDQEARRSILDLKLKDIPSQIISPDIDLNQLAVQTTDYTAADLEGMVSDACMTAFRKKSQVTQDILFENMKKKSNKDEPASSLFS